jgi:hypothetical protein
MEPSEPKNTRPESRICTRSQRTSPNTHGNETDSIPISLEPSPHSRNDDVVDSVHVVYTPDDENEEEEEEEEEEGEVHIAKVHPNTGLKVRLSDFAHARKETAKKDCIRLLCVTLIAVASVVCIGLGVETQFFTNILFLLVGILVDSPLQPSQNEGTAWQKALTT